MNHPGPWSYAQHYPRLPAGVNSPQPGQLGDLALPASLPRQDQMGGYGLIHGRHGLNGSQPMAHTDGSFVNTGNVMAGPYDPMLSNFPPPEKSLHTLGPINIAHPHGAPIFKNMGKERDHPELRGGFVWNTAPPNVPVTNADVTLRVAASGSDNNMAMGGMYNPQASPHSWRSSDILPTPSSPFGVLPHETVMHRSSVDINQGPGPSQASSKSHSQGSSKGGRGMPDNGQYLRQDGNYTNVTFASGSGGNCAPGMMMPQPTVNSSTVSETQNTMSNIKTPDYVEYHSNATTMPMTVNTQLRPVAAQNYVSHSQFPAPNMQQTAGNGNTVITSAMYSGGIPTITNASTSVSGHGSKQHLHHRSNTEMLSGTNAGDGSGQNSHLVSSNITPPMVTNATPSPSSQSRDLPSDYSAYSATPTIPTNSQSYLAIQMPSPMQSQVQGLPSTQQQQMGIIPTQSNSVPGQHHPNFGPHAADSTNVDPCSNVAYSSVVTRASDVGSGDYSNSMMQQTPQHSKSKSKHRHGQSRHGPINQEVPYPSGSPCLLQMGLPPGTPHNVVPQSPKQGNNVEMNGNNSTLMQGKHNIPMNQVYNGLEGLNGFSSVNESSGPMVVHRNGNGNPVTPVLSSPSLSTSGSESEVVTKKQHRHHRRKRDTVESDASTGVIGPMTPLNAKKLYHKMAPPLHHPPIESLSSPMNLSGDVPSAQQWQQMASGNATPVSTDINLNVNDAPQQPNSYVIQQNIAYNTDASSSMSEHTTPSPSQLPSTPAPPVKHTPSMRSRPSIEDDLCFLADFASDCIVSSKLSSPVNRPSKQDGFLESYLQFVKTGGEVVSESDTSKNPQVSGRGRGPRSGGTSSRGETGSFSKVSVTSCVELNPSTGLFVPCEPSSSPDESGKDLLDLINAEEIEPKERETSSSCVKPTKEKKTPKADAAKFSDDEDFSPKGLDSLVKSAISDLREEDKVKESNKDIAERPTVATDEEGKTKNDESVKRIPSVVIVSSPPGADGRPQELKIKLVGIQSSQVQTIQRGKSRGGSSATRKAKGRRGSSTAEVGFQDDSSEQTPLPTRRLSMRKCKEKTLQQRQEKLRKRKKSESDSEEYMAWSNSDSEPEKRTYDSDEDPAWTPVVDKVVTEGAHCPSDEDTKLSGGRGRRRSRLSSGLESSRGKSRRIFTEEPIAAVNVQPAITQPAKVKQKQGPKEGREETEFAVREGTGKVGDFVIAVADLDKPTPPIWRIDSKRLLQKFEPFQREGRLMYKNKSMYSGWTFETRCNYQTIFVKVITSSTSSYVVEYLREQVKKDNSNDNNVASVKINSAVSEKPEVQNDAALQQELSQHKESFEVYIQTLISQALDPNFISEIIKERDDYFLSHVRDVDELVERCKNKVLLGATWGPKLKQCIERYPRFLSSVLRPNEQGAGYCQACNTVMGSVLVELSGNAYNVTTLIQNGETSSDDALERKYLMCAKCVEQVKLYNQIHHQKYNFFVFSASKVNSIRSADPSKESHIILEHCLQDTNWMNKVFQDVLSIWIRCFHYQR